MKKFALLLTLVFAAGVAVAQDAPKAQDAKAPAKAEDAKAPAAAESQAAKAAVKTHKIDAEIVSADVEKKTITIKGETENKTAPVEGKAVAALKNVKAGEKWTLTCRDSAAGEHEAVIAMHKTPATKASAAKKTDTAKVPEKN